MPDSDLTISGGRQSSRPLDKGGGGAVSKIFWALRASMQFGLKNERGAGSPGPSPESATGFVLNFKRTYCKQSPHVGDCSCVPDSKAQGPVSRKSLHLRARKAVVV